MSSMTAEPTSASAITGSQPPRLPEPDSHGITLESWDQVDPTVPATQPRLIDATVTTDAIYEARDDAGEPTIDPLTVPFKVRILLPANYKTDRRHRYPVLYLLHGGGGNFENWSNDGDIENIVANSSFDGIVVMPEGGWAGWYTDWVGGTDGHFAPQWETFHIRQLVPWIDANFNTIKGRSGRAIAGLSMGGLGALMYAGRFQRFSAVGSFSGGTDLSQPAGHKIIGDSMGVIGAAVLWHGVGDPNFLVSGDNEARMRVIFGSPGRNGQWDKKNPIRLAAAGKYNRYDGKMAVYVGNTGTDAFLGAANDELHGVLVDEGVEHRYCTGPGEHSFQYWTQDLADFLEYVYGDTPETCPNGWGDPVD
jgi:S-formylglutathione hydrolase FrmB